MNWELKIAMRVMVLAGGNDQIILMQHIRERYKNVLIFLVDYLDNPVAKGYADYHIQISTLDKDLVLETAQKEKIDRIFTACTDQALVTMAYVAEKMKLPTYITYNQALCITDKLRMKKIMIDSNVPTSRYLEVESKEQLDSIALSFPLVIKPTDSNSSKGIRKVTDKRDLAIAYDTAIAFSREKKVILEEYFDGKEYSIDAWVNNDKADVLLITETIKNKEKKEGFQIVESYYDNDIQTELIQVIKPIVQKLCNAFEIHNGPMIIQVLVNKNLVSVIELSARTGGGSKIDLIKKLAKFDVIENLLNCFEGDYNIPRTTPYQGWASMHYVYMKEGIFADVRGLDKLYPNIIEKYFMYKEKGSQIEKAENSSDRVMGYLLMADSREELFYKQKQVETYLKILNEKEEDMWIRNIYLYETDMH